MFKVGDEVIADASFGRTISCHITNITNSDTVIWGTWYWDNDPARVNPTYGFMNACDCQLVSAIELKYDPLQQGDKDEDI